MCWFCLRPTGLKCIDRWKVLVVICLPWFHFCFITSLKFNHKDSTSSSVRGIFSNNVFCTALSVLFWSWNVLLIFKQKCPDWANYSILFSANTFSQVPQIHAHTCKQILYVRNLFCPQTICLYLRICNFDNFDIFLFNFRLSHGLPQGNEIRFQLSQITI